MRLVCTSLLLFAASLYAADTPVLVSDIFYLQSPDAWNGTITVSWPSFTTAQGTQIAKGSREYVVTSGVIAIPLYATQGAAPSVVYTVRWRSTGAGDRGMTWTEYWSVPISSTSVNLQTVRPVSSLSVGYGLVYKGLYAGRPASPHVNDLALFTDAATAGECPPSGGSAYAACAWNGSNWVAFAGTGSGSSSGINGTSTWTQIEAGTAPPGNIGGTMTWSQIEAQ